MAIMGLDTPQSAGQAQEVNPDDELFSAMVAGLRQHIFGPGEQGIVQAMQQADDPGRVMGEIVFALIRESAQQAEEQGAEFSWDVLIGVATEVIDDIVELMDAHGMQLDDKAREYALLFAQQLYVESANPGPEERQAAQQDLAMQKESGEFDEAVKYVQMRGTEAGADPFGVESMGQRPGIMGRGQ